MRTWNSLFKRLSMALVALFGVLGLLEAALRLTAQRRGEQAALLYDRSRANYYPQEARLHPWSRDATHVLRIAVIGDSITIGHGVQLDDTYGMRLERLLNMNEGVPPAEVRIYAQGGLSTFMEVHLLKRALKSQADVILLGLCHNDTEDWLRPDEIRRWREDMMPRVPGPWLGAVLRRSQALAWLYQGYQNERAKRGRIRYYRRIYDVEYSGWKRFRKALRQFRELTSEAGARLLVVVFPGVSDLDRDPLAFTHRQLRRALEEEGLEYLDLLGEYAGRPPVRMHAIPYLDGHPSEIAHRMAAEAIFEALLARGFVDEAYFPQGMKQSRQGYWEWIRTRMQAPHLPAEPAPPPEEDFADDEP